ncbi:hypothetical protein ABI59_18305 [Acidobacteria bacterium Mor1]|nr:hypothetical protein ABI59_18305 [Acidobacteria bacterium Mor1]
MDARKNLEARHDSPSWKCRKCHEPLMPKLCRACSGRSRVGALRRSECEACEGQGFLWRCPQTAAHRHDERSAVYARRTQSSNPLSVALYLATHPIRTNRS